MGVLAGKLVAVSKVGLREEVGAACACIHEIARTRAFAWGLLMLLCADGVVVALHGMQVILRDAGSAHWLASPWFNLGSDRGLGEAVEYLKFALCGAAAFMLRRRLGARIYTTVAALYAWGLADNALALHEWAGDRAVGAGIDDDLGELAALTLVAAVSLSLLLRQLPLSSREERAPALIYLALFGLFTLFAVALDAVHTAVVLEDGGELVTLSVHAAYSFALLRPRASAGAAEGPGRRRSTQETIAG